MDDLVTFLVLGLSGFFVALSIGLLVRYRQVSKDMSVSNDLGHDLWSALESRLNRQDERIVDVLTRVDVLQAQVLSKSLPEKSSSMTFEESVPKSDPVIIASRESSQDVTKREHVSVHSPSHDLESNPPEMGLVESKLDSQERRLGEIFEKLDVMTDALMKRGPGTLDVQPHFSSTRTEQSRPGKVSELQLLGFLGEKSRTPLEVLRAFNISREHAARLLKSLFDRGLAIRNDSGKPYVYELTELGRRQLSQS